MRLIKHTFRILAPYDQVKWYLNRAELSQRLASSAPDCGWMIDKLFTGLWDIQVDSVDQLCVEVINTIKYSFFEALFKKKRAQRFLSYFEMVMKNDLNQLKAFGLFKPKKILIAGSSGFVGKVICSIFSLFGHEVKRLVRRSVLHKNEIFWNPEKKLIDPTSLEGLSTVINLCGESIFSLRWTKKKKERILSSRITPTAFLVDVLSSLKRPPELFISASAVGYYGDRAGEVLSEDSKKGCGFLSDVAEKWEACSQKLKVCSVLNTRFGVVIGSTGGILKKIKLFTRLGFGSWLGRGDQWISWIAVDDLAYQMMAISMHPPQSKAVNFVAPDPVTSDEMMNLIAKRCHRKVFLRIPKWILRMILGELSSLILYSQKAYPKILLENDAIFAFAKIEEALDYYLMVIKK